MPNFVQYYKTKYVNAELSITEVHGGGALVSLRENHGIEAFCYALPFRGFRKMGSFRMSLTVVRRSFLYVALSFID